MMSLISSSASKGSSGPRPSMSLSRRSTTADCSGPLSRICSSASSSVTISPTCWDSSSRGSCEAAARSRRSMTRGWIRSLAVSTAALWETAPPVAARGGASGALVATVPGAGAKGLLLTSQSMRLETSVLRSSRLKLSASSPRSSVTIWPMRNASSGRGSAPTLSFSKASRRSGLMRST